MSSTPEFDEALVQRLPLPLAQLYRRAHNAKTPLERHLNAFYLWEAAIKLLAGGALARYGAIGEFDAIHDAQLLDSLTRPALVDWWSAVGRTVPKLANRGDLGYRAVREAVFNRAHDDLPHAAQLNSQLAEFVGGRRVARTTVRLTELIDRLIEFRNREVGHGASAARGDDFHARWGPLLLAGAAEVLGRVNVLAGRQLAYSNALGAVQWWNLTGERSTPLVDRVAWKDAPGRHPGCVYLLGPDPNAPPAPLHPLAMFDTGGSNFFFYHTDESTDYEYLNYTTGEVRKAAPRWPLAALLAGRVPAAASADASPTDDPATQPGPAEPTNEPPMRRTLGEFELLGELGRGGMGVVYRAWQPSLGREVALKRLPWTGSARAIERFRHEIEALSRVDHPNLIRIYTSGTEGEDRYFTMELVEGTTLAEVCAAARSARVPVPGWSAVVAAAWAERWETASKEKRAEADLPPVAETPRLGPDAIRRVVELIVQVADAAHALHEAGVIHRDIKPGNVMVDRTGTRATLMDLGVAQLQEEKAKRTLATFVGTLRFISPEGLNNSSADARSDVYSLGATLWEALTLRPLFEDSPNRSMLLKVLIDSVDSARSVNPGIDRGLDEIVLRCLSKQPVQRYASARALAEELRRWLAGERPAERLSADSLADLGLADLLAAAGSGSADSSSSESGIARGIDWPANPGTGAVSMDWLSDERTPLLEPAPWFALKQKNLILMVVAVVCGLVAAHLTSQMSAAPNTKADWRPPAAEPVTGGTAAYAGWALAAVFAAVALFQWARVRELRAELEPTKARLEQQEGLLASMRERRESEPKPELKPLAELPHDPPGEALPPLPPLPPPPAFEPPVPVPPAPVVAPETTRPTVTAGRTKLRAADEAFSSQTVVLRYPAPIAIAYRRFCSRKEPADRVAQLFSTFEMTIKYLVYLAHSDLARARISGGAPFPALPTHSGFDFARRSIHMTLGQWLVALRAAADELAKRPDRFFAELPEVCGTGGVIDREIVQWIKNNRNVWAHIEDGQSLTTEECGQLLPQARPRLERLFQEIGFVRNYPLGFVTAGYPGSGDLIRYRVHSCMGARVAHGEEVYPMETAVRFPVGVPFVVSPDESEALCLWPFLLYRESDATQRPALYVFKSIEQDERFLAAVEAVAIDHKDTWCKRLNPTAGASHDWMWEALAKMPQTVAITPDLRLADGLAESLVGRLTGEALGDKKQYKLIGPIARGGFGTVYDAVDTRTGTRVAVKVLEDREGLDPKEDMAQFKRFQQEYEKLQKAGAATTGFVRTFEWGTSIIGRREYPWFSMEFAAGGDLTARLEERRTALQEHLPWTEPEARAAVVAEFRAVATAVANLHELGIVHRDIKPGNILVMDGGELRLSDFGLVKDLDRPRAGASAGPGSTRGAVVGTRDYMAPEQERGETVTRAADVYALGVLLAELSTGRRPVASAGAVAGSPVEGDERVQKLPDALRRLISRCTDFAPKARPEDAGHVLLEFEKVARKPN